MTPRPTGYALRTRCPQRQVEGPSNLAHSLPSPIHRHRATCLGFRGDVMRAGWVTAVSLSVMLASAGVAAQWLNFKTPGVPRRPDGTPKLDSPAPRTVDGHPDLTGVWMH